jgi:1-acyl-sn-glycerol-3-phosphate acyltransferase
MIDLARLNAISLRPKPRLQRLIGALLLGPNYNLPGRRTRIVVEGRERIPPGGGAILVMNHTDRYNYWPLQYAMWRERVGFTATWVKGKYYENRLLGWFMDAANNIPIPSKGYVLTKDFAGAMGRLPDEREYGALKRLADGEADEERTRVDGGERVRAFLSRPWPDAPSARWVDSLAARFDAMMARVVALNHEALAIGLYLLVFPQGTRSRRLTAGHTGAAQVAAHTGAPVIPIGCNGSDRCYPGNSPWSRGGTIVYRVGEPLTADGELAPFAVPEPFTPFTASAEKWNERFRAATDLMMQRINALLDPEYQFSDENELEKGARRFV